MFRKRIEQKRADEKAKAERKRKREQQKKLKEKQKNDKVKKEVVASNTAEEKGSEDILECSGSVTREVKRSTRNRKTPV